VFSGLLGVLILIGLFLIVPSGRTFAESLEETSDDHPMGILQADLEWLEDPLSTRIDFRHLSFSPFSRGWHHRTARFSVRYDQDGQSCRNDPDHWVVGLLILILGYVFVLSCYIKAILGL